ncbi:uncharacterized protein LOC113298028 isoform X1 [Papaver somniferum]|uniref:uncharacterized protein LOC113298028 isoform X1 n=1 Tax=Papaver somniferum TaxID=3469 RepID=UPI000E6F83E3|nr:uncharacterized protein LOC113298028 isoform X1 [Papaver somniferum]XP_026402449.1 uncharacterized protein LOC113298028 isoform X1 [Papaver somniferum]XP_026402450.1 uncharacterized protein LOC113298028 isoform X1 [Papaver somniferum]XP_026402451.1 uncharacterized protein LOC113298028 isoform X1 [Papaver somniferum]XP_026402452.1 uncharacterized protein LOC113298028 isoform X1 [Papaver somniferum]
MVVALESEFYRRIFGKAKSVTKASIREAIYRLVKANGANEMEPSIRRTDNEDLAMLIGLYMCNTIFFTTKDAITIKEKYLGLVVNFERCKTLSWAHLIHAHLARRINKSFKNPENITGCVFYLPIWFAEHTKIVVPKALPEDKFVPTAGRWNLKQICTALLKDMDESKYVFDQKFVEPYTEKEKVVLNMSEEGGIMFLEEGREDKYEELRMTIKSSWEQMQKMDCNNEEVVPKMQEMLNKIYFKAYPDIQPDRIHKEFDDSVQLDDDAKLDVPMSHQEAPEDDSNSVQVKKDDDAKVDVPMSHQEAPEDDSNSSQVKNDKRVEFDDSVQLDDNAKVDVPMSHQEAPEDDSNSVQVKNDKRVELVFDDDVENMDVADILIGLKETPRLETSATAINPEPTPIVTDAGHTTISEDSA